MGDIYQVLDEFDLISHFGASENRHQTFVSFIGKGAQKLYLSLKKTTSHSVFVSDACNTRVGTMSCPKGVVHIDIPQSG